jgi:hypothetical protein
VTAALELAEDAFGRHLALEVLDRTLESTFTDVNFDRLTLSAQGGPDFPGVADLTTRNACLIRR